MLLFNCSFVCMFFRSLLGETEMKKKWWQAQRTIVFVSLLAILVSLLALLMPKLAPDKSEPTAPKTAEQPPSPKLAEKPKSSKSAEFVHWNIEFLKDCQVVLVKTNAGFVGSAMGKLPGYELVYGTLPWFRISKDEFILIVRLKPPAKEKQ